MNRREYNRQETIRHIKSNFLLGYEAYGIDKININELCAQSMVAKSTFYQYFDDKYSILESIENELLDGLILLVFEAEEELDIQSLLKGEPAKIGLSVVRFLNQHKQAFKALLGVNGDPVFVKKWHKYIVKSFVEIFQEKASSKKQGKLAASLFASSILELYRYYLSETPKMSERECAIMAGNLLKCFLYDFEAFV